MYSLIDDLAQSKNIDELNKKIKNVPDWFKFNDYKKLKESFITTYNNIPKKDKSKETTAITDEKNNETTKINPEEVSMDRWITSVFYDKKVLNNLIKLKQQFPRLYIEQKNNLKINSTSKQPKGIQVLPKKFPVNQQKSPSNTQKTRGKRTLANNSRSGKIILSNNRHSLPPTTNQIIDASRSYANAIYEKMFKLNVDEKLKAMFEEIKNKLNAPNDKIKFSGNEKLSLDVSFQKLIEFRDALSHTLDQLEKSGENNLTQNIENDVKIINTYLGLDNTSPLTQNQSKSSTNKKASSINSKEKVQEDKKTNSTTAQANTKTPDNSSKAKNEPDEFKEALKILNDTSNETSSQELENQAPEYTDKFLDDILKTL